MILHRQLDAKRVNDSISGQVLILRLAIGVDSDRIKERIRLEFICQCRERHGRLDELTTRLA
jgi:hypothetical protein